MPRICTHCDSPTADCLERLHKRNVKLYWTEDSKGDAPQSGLDVVGGNIIVNVPANGTDFTNTSNGDHVDSFSLHGTTTRGGGTVANESRRHFTAVRVEQKIQLLSSRQSPIRSEHHSSQS